MLKKTIKREERKNRPTWKPYYERVTENKKGKGSYNRQKFKKGMD